jgi:cell division protease FtsH
MGPVYTVSIIPTGIGAAGYTMPLPENDNVFNTKEKMLQEIQVDFGGRIAEELIFHDVTTGASQDIRQASKTARDMVVRYGFSEKVGMINYETAEDDEVFIGRDIGHEAHYSEAVKSLIDAEVKRIIDECYAKAKKTIEEHMDVLHKAADLLLEKEKITGEEFVSLFETA